MEFYRILWTSMGIRENLWQLQNSMGFYGNPWKSMETHGNPGKSIEIEVFDDL